jgi:hypothetical protein
MGSELFPTSYRSTSSAARGVINTVSGIAGLATESILYSFVGFHSLSVILLLALAPLAIVPVIFFLPETARLSLDEISPEVELDVDTGPKPFL